MNARISETPNTRKLLLIFALASFFLIGFCGQNLTWAQEKGYPSQPIKLIVPSSPGGGADLRARVIADLLEKELKVPAIVENKQGAGGMLGASLVLKAKPDGYTLLAGGDTAFSTGLLQSPDTPYNPYTDFLPLCGLGVYSTAFGVYSSSPFKTLKDFASAAKANPGKLSCGMTTIGSSSHLMLVLLKKYAGIDIKIVPYAGSPQAITSLLGKHVDMIILTSTTFLPLVKGGEARVVAVSSPVPGHSFKTFGEEGFPQPEFQAVEGFSAYHVSAKTPKPIYDKLVATFERIAKNPAFVDKMNSLGSPGAYSNPAEFRADFKYKMRVTADVLEELGMKKNPLKIE